MRKLHRADVVKLISTRLIPLFFISFIVSSLAACGGSKATRPSLFPGKISLNPSSSATVQLGNTINFSASAQNASGSNVAATFTYQSSDTSILNIAPNGVACAGLFDASFVNCTPGNYGVVQVTASAFGATSLPTLVYVHPPIDNIKISLVTPVTQPPPACPGQQKIPQACAPPPTVPAQQCLSANQTMILQAQAFSKGVDITASVGPFTWSEASPSVVGISLLVTNTNTNLATSQVTVTPNAPGFTPVYASASTISSQPYYAETCPVQCIALEVGNIGSDQFSFSTNKGTSETVVATAVDIQGCVVPKPALTWASSQPASIVAGTATSGCAAGTTCSVSTPQPGAGSVTASCIPPSCNIGFPQSVAGLPQALVQPQPVYPVTAISGLATGATASTNVLATSLDCAANLFCTDYLYSVSTSTNQTGNGTPFPAPPNSLLFDPAGDKAYMGGNYEALTVNPANIGGANSPFGGLGTVTGKVLATSSNGSYAIFSDTAHIPNQVYVVNTANASSPSITPLYIAGATLAGFSPDGLKAFILGTVTDPASNIATVTLYVYSPIQALQTFPVASGVGASATAIVFSANGAFAYIAGDLPTPEIAVYGTCDNQPATAMNSSVPQVISLTTAPLFMQALPDATHIIALNASGFDYITSTFAGPTFPLACPNFVSNSTAQRIDLNQGTIHPIAFFMSSDASTAYIVASDLSSILAFNFATNSNIGIPLTSTNGATVTPVTASISVDGTLIYVAASDGQLHEVSTVMGADLAQIAFPNLPNVTDPFCVGSVPCNLNFVAVKP